MRWKMKWKQLSNGKKRKHELVTQIIAYDKENQILTNKVEVISKQVRELEAEAIEASAEATLLE